MIGPLALHGGAEFRQDDRFLEELLRTISGESSGERGRRPGAPVRVVLLPTALARHQPALGAAMGIAAFERVALDRGVAIRAAEARVVDEASAADERLADRLEDADLIYLPGGDPDVVLDVLGGSRAWEAVTRARLAGALVAGASAGAMALASWSWTPGEIRRGFGWIRDVLVVPHATTDRVARAATERERVLGRDDIGVLLLDERTGVIGDGGTWTVAGSGCAHWLAPRAREVVSHRDGAAFRT